MKFDRRTIVSLLGLAAPLVFAVAVMRYISPWLPEFALWVESLGVWAPIAYVFAYILAVVLMMPAFLLIIVGGAVFGITYGATLAMTGALTGACAAFLIARHWARDYVARHVAKNATLTAVDRVIGENGLKLIFLLRLSPVVPFVLTNYAMGATRVRFTDFAFGTLGLIPIVVTYAALGKVSGSTTIDGSRPVSTLTLSLGVLATLILGVLLARLIKRAIREAHIETAPVEEV